jgi:hypothetical protein
MKPLVAIGGLAVTVPALIQACGGGRQPESDLGPMRELVTIEVVNDNYHDATIYAEYEGLVPERIGFVVGHTTDTMLVHWHPTQLRMIMHLVGAGDAASDGVMVDPGDFIQLRLMPDLHLKTVRR